MRAVPSLRTIAGLTRDQQRAALSTLPGLEDEEAVDKLIEFFQVAAIMPPELWVQMAADLPADTVRALVGGP
jgi:HEAT repeat protein